MNAHPHLVSNAAFNLGLDFPLSPNKRLEPSAYMKKPYRLLFHRFATCASVLLLGFALAFPSASLAVSFSTDENAIGKPGSGVNANVENPQKQNNIYYGGVPPFIGTNVRDVFGGPGGIGLSQGSNLRSLSKGKDPTTGMVWDVLFSVDVNSRGQPDTAVRMEADGQEAAGDVFFFNAMNPNGSNTLRPWGEENEHGLVKGVVGQGDEDELDAFDIYEGEFEPQAARYLPTPTSIFFSIAGDILVTNGAGGPIDLFKNGIIDIGLQARDLIDALALDLAHGKAFFSLAPGSPTLGLLAPGSPGLRNWSAADILSTSFTGTFGIADTGFGPFFAENIGLLATDNLDALDTALQMPVRPQRPRYVPDSSSSFVLLLLGALSLATARKYLATSKSRL